ncbi:MAG: phosphoribosylglycinamide formyltransferase, partial [Clostridiaceae bacterium]|nr:phosphoribosylglycinamide formyltransferase [Clostridiaceae bacterium]
TPEILQKRVMEQAEWVILPKAVAQICNQYLVCERNDAL